MKRHSPWRRRALAGALILLLSAGCLEGVNFWNAAHDYTIYARRGLDLSSKYSVYESRAGSVLVEVDGRSYISAAGAFAYEVRTVFVRPDQAGVYVDNGLSMQSAEYPWAQATTIKGSVMAIWVGHGDSRKVVRVSTSILR